MKTKRSAGPIWETTEKGRVLCWEGKHSNEYWLADTPERFKAAFLAMFELLDQNEYYYELSGEDTYNSDELVKLKKKVALLSGDPDLIDNKEVELIARLERDLEKEKGDQVLYQKAKAGDWKAAWDLISRRGDYEYEGWSFIPITDPTTKPEK